MGFVANFIRFSTVHIFWKSVKIWESHRELKSGNFFQDTVWYMYTIWRTWWVDDIVLQCLTVHCNLYAANHTLSRW